MTRITSTSTYTQPEFHGFYPEGTPDYVHDALCKAGFSNLEQYGAIEFEAVDVTREHAQANFKYRSAINFCELSLDVAGHQSTWILYGEPPRIYDAGGTLDALLKDDFQRLDALGAGWSCLLPWFPRHARRAVAPFMESEVHQEIVDADHQGLAPNVIVEKLNRSLSTDYIERSLIRLRQVVQVAGRWSSLKWSIGIAIASIPFTILSVAMMEHAKPHTMLVTQEHLVLFPWISGSQTSWTIALLTVPFSVAGWFCAKWMSHQWIKRSGGKQLVAWARQKGLLIGKWTALATIVTTATVAANFFERWPIWVDKNGKLYGVVATFQHPKMIEPVLFQPREQTSHHRSHGSRQTSHSMSQK